MWRRARILGVLLAIACVTYPELGVSAPDTATKIEIGKSEIGAPPAEFELSPLSDANQGSWTVVRDTTAKTGIAIEQAGVQSTEHQPPLAIYKSSSFNNAEITLRLNATGGRSHQGGGVAVRLSRPQDYYLGHLDALMVRMLFS